MKEKKPSKLLQKIFDLRKKQKITLRQLGNVMGVGATTAGEIENGEVGLKARHLPAVAKLLKVEAWELLVDYEEGQVGPLSQEEKELLIEVRQHLPKAKQIKALTRLLKSL